MKNYFLSIALLCTPFVQADVLYTYTKNNVTLTIENDIRCPEILRRNMPQGVNALFVTIENNSNDEITVFKDDIRANVHLASSMINFGKKLGIAARVAALSGVVVGTYILLFFKKARSLEESMKKWAPTLVLLGIYGSMRYANNQENKEITAAIDRWNFNTNSIRVSPGAKFLRCG